MTKVSNSRADRLQLAIKAKGLAVRTQEAIPAAFIDEQVGKRTVRYRMEDWVKVQEYRMRSTLKLSDILPVAGDL